MYELWLTPTHQQDATRTLVMKYLRVRSGLICRLTHGGPYTFLFLAFIILFHSWVTYTFHHDNNEANLKVGKYPGLFKKQWRHQAANNFTHTGRPTMKVSGMNCFSVAMGVVLVLLSLESEEKSVVFLSSQNWYIW